MFAESGHLTQLSPPPCTGQPAGPRRAARQEEQHSSFDASLEIYVIHPPIQVLHYVWIPRNPGVGVVRAKPLHLQLKLEWPHADSPVRDDFLQGGEVPEE